MSIDHSLNRLAKAGRIISRLQPTVPGMGDRLSDLPAPRQNPGRLRGRFYVPEGLATGAPLVVVLHGCTQSAADYDQGSGWSKLADRHGFALLFPEQTRENNPNLCFNWFTAGHSQRGMGEPASIKAMIDAMVKAHGLDRGRVFVTGLSAGGAMTAVMLATYPELFAAGAIIAGLPYGCASGVAQAFDCMGGRARAEAAELGAKVLRASPHKGPWPRVSVWQGGADTVVVPSNADAIVAQWLSVHGLPAEPSRAELTDGHPHRLWLGPDGAALVEHYDIAGMAHGVPLRPGEGEGELGRAGAHMLDIGVSSTERIAAFFGIAPAPVAALPRARAAPPANRRRVPRQADSHLESATGIQAVIEGALKSAGLMR